MEYNVTVGDNEIMIVCIFFAGIFVTLLVKLFWPDLKRIFSKKQKS